VYSEHATLALVGNIHDAVNDETLWPTFLDQFAHALQAQVGTLYIHDLRSQKGSAELVIGMDPTYDQAYCAYYAARNIYMRRGKPLLVVGKVMTSEELCPDEEVFSSEFYNDWVLPQRLGRGLNGVLFSSGSLVGSIGAIRARGAKTFALEDKRFLQAGTSFVTRADAPATMPFVRSSFRTSCWVHGSGLSFTTPIAAWNSSPTI
jgi:hypothetical protein